MSSELEKAFSDLLKNPQAVDSLRRSSEISSFKEEYGAERSSLLKCPACSQWGQTGGSLWIVRGTKDEFVCRKCKLKWKMECLTTPIEELTKQIREVSK